MKIRTTKQKEIESLQKDFRVKLFADDRLGKIGDWIDVKFGNTISDMINDNIVDKIDEL